MTLSSSVRKELSSYPPEELARLLMEFCPRSVALATLRHAGYPGPADGVCAGDGPGGKGCSEPTEEWLCPFEGTGEIAGCGTCCVKCKCPEAI